MRTHIVVVAWLHIILSALTLLGGLVVFLFFGGLAGVAAAQGGSGAIPGVAVFGGIGTIVLAAIALYALPGLIMGWGLLNFAPWARILAIVLSILSLLHPAVGIGTAIGIYSLIILFNPETVALFDRRRSTSY